MQFFIHSHLILFLIIDEKNMYRSEGNKAETLLKYKKLLDEGIITQEEFDKKKKEYL